MVRSREVADSKPPLAKRIGRSSRYRFPVSNSRSALDQVRSWVGTERRAAPLLPARPPLFQPAIKARLPGSGAYVGTSRLRSRIGSPVPPHPLKKNPSQTESSRSNRPRPSNVPCRHRPSRSLARSTQTPPQARTLELWKRVPETCCPNTSREPSPKKILSPSKFSPPELSPLRKSCVISTIPARSGPPVSSQSVTDAVGGCLRNVARAD